MALLATPVAWETSTTWGQLPASSAPPATGLWVEILDSRGKVPESLSPSDLEVLEGGAPQSILSVDQNVAGQTRIALYFDRALSSGRNLKQAASDLGLLAEELIRLGEVEVITAEDTPNTELITRDALVLGERLSRMALTESGERRLLDLRRRTLEAIQPGGRLVLQPSEIAALVTSAIREELEIAEQRQKDLLHWAATPRPQRVGDAIGPQLLFVVLDGFDLDPVSFYAQHLPPEAMREVLRSSNTLPPLSPVVAATSQALAGLGWTVLPIANESKSDEEEAFGYSALESSSPDGSVTSGAGVTVKPGELFGRRRKEPEQTVPEATFVQPREPLEQLAEDSGGEVVVSNSGLRDALTRFGQRFHVTYAPSGDVSKDSRTLEVRAAGRLSVRGSRWAPGGVPEAVSRMRLERLLNGFEADGGFDVAAVLQTEPAPYGEEATAGQLEARLDLRDLLASSEEEEWVVLDDADLRVSVAVVAEDGSIDFQHQIFEDQNLRERREGPYESRLELPASRGGVAVLVEDLRRGHWGGRRATVVSGGDDLDIADLPPTPTVLEIVPPEESILRGRVKLETRVIDPAVARVDFLLDERQVAQVTRPPFSARVDFGRTPLRQTLTVIAFDREGQELGRDKAVLNGGDSGLGVEIVRPTKPRGTGRVEVEAEIAVPVERRLDRVLFFWNSEPVATLYGAPFRQWVNIPPDKPVGYVRVVALLDDGSTAEDVVFMNGPESAERVDVSLVELYVVVTDDDGRPVRNLSAADFQVQENGRQQTIATFSDASDLPITLGLAIDSSASMFVKLPGVQQAAVDFLHSAFSEQDRAFVVDFDSEPRLVRSTTGDLRRLEQSIQSLEADGRTAMWESIVYSLVQLQGVRGRKALIVFSDGADEDDKFPFRSLMGISRRMGVPIYLILMKKKPERDGLSLFMRSFGSRVQRLVEATGGRVFYSREYDTLSEVYDVIERELRSQYLLAYYPEEPSRSAAWRSVDVEVKKKGLETRTLSGYWQ